MNTGSTGPLQVYKNRKFWNIKQVKSIAIGQESCICHFGIIETNTTKSKTKRKIFTHRLFFLIGALSSHSVASSSVWRRSNEQNSVWFETQSSHMARSLDEGVVCVGFPVSNQIDNCRKLKDVIGNYRNMFFLFFWQLFKLVN